MPSARRLADLLLGLAVVPALLLGRTSPELAVVPALLLGRTSPELEAARARHAALAADVARLGATLATAPGLEVELRERRAVLAKLLTILPSPEVATPERLLELVQACWERSGVVSTWAG